MTTKSDTFIVSMPEDEPATTDTSTESFTPISSKLLSIHVQGCFSFMERLPLWFKLLFLSVLSIAGMVFFGMGLIANRAEMTHKAVNGRAFTTLSAFAKDLPLALAYERAFAALILETRLPTFHTEMSQQRTVVDPLLSSIQTTAQDLLSQQTEVESRAALTQLVALKQNVQLARRNFDASIFNDTTLILDTYSQFIDTINSALLRLCMQTTSQRMCTLHNALLRSADFFGQNIALGSIMLVRQNTTATITSLFAASFDRTLAFVDFSMDMGTTKEIAMMNETFYGPLGSKIYLLSMSLLHIAQGNNRTLALQSFMNVDAYVNVTIAGLNSIFDLTRALESSIQQVTLGEVNLSIGIIVTICILVLLCFFVSQFSILCFSRSITGPWERMNSLLESTISQFVPRDILGIIKVPRIIDLKYGLVVEKQLTVLRSSIANYAQIVAKMTPSERFNFYNTFLNAIGPIIRKHSGFIEKYLPDGYVAIFKTNKEGLRAAAELSTYCEVFNKTFQDLPNVKLHSAVSTGDCLVGTVGEAQRMDVSLLGEAATIVQRMVTMNNKYKTKILASKQTLSSKASIQSRFIARLRVSPDQPEVEVFEVLTKSDATKHPYANQFSEAVRSMQSYEFDKAFEQLAAIVKLNPQDLTAEYQYQQCKSIINDKELATSVKLSLDDVLADDILYDAFQEFCTKELSYENVRVYNLISQFKAAAPNERRKLVLTLYEEFLAADSKYELNVNEKFKQDLKTQLAKNDFAFEANALDALQTEIELLMTDTHKRFKHSEVLRKALRKKSIVQA